MYVHVFSFFMESYRRLGDIYDNCTFFTFIVTDIYEQKNTFKMETIYHTKSSQKFLSRKLYFSWHQPPPTSCCIMSCFHISTYQQGILKLLHMCRLFTKCSRQSKHFQEYVIIMKNIIIGIICLILPPSPNNVHFLMD
jgi:hypothetical protein